MPDNYYYASNGKSASKNYVEIYRKNQKRVKELLDKRSYEEQSRRETKDLEKEIDKQVESKLEKMLDDAFVKLMKK